MVGKSKVISGLATHQAHRRRKDTVMGSQISADTYGQYRDPKGTVSKPFLPTFHAGLTNNTDAKTAGSAIHPGEFTRASDGTYINRQGNRVLADNNESRHEYQSGNALGCLMEPANTNKCENYNANPDEALSNINQIGDPAAVFSRAQDVEELAAAGLAGLCSSGFVFKLDNSAGTGGAEIQFEGNTTNLNDHIISAYARIDPASAGTVEVKPSGQPGVDVTNSNYEHIVLPFTPLNADRVAALNCQAGGIGYIILNQLEEQPLPTSVIVTEGAATSRAIDQLQWPLIDGQGNNSLNQAQGMAALLWRPGYAEAQAPDNVQRGLVVLRNGNTSLMYLNTAGAASFGTSDGTNFPGITIVGGLVADVDYLILVRWQTGQGYQVGYKQGGTARWSTEEAYDGAYVEEGFLRLSQFPASPEHYRDLYLWPEDKGTAWLESFFSGIAN